MKIKFKNLNKIYLIATIVAPICVLVQIFEPNIGRYSEALKSISLTIIILFGVSGFSLAIFEKIKIIHISYSEKDKKSIFYKIIKFAENMNKKQK